MPPVQTVTPKINQPLWTPKTSTIETANMTHFRHFIAQRLGVAFDCYDDLYAWSVQQSADFWSAFWDWAQIVGDRNTPPIMAVGSSMADTRFFPNALLNYGENLLSNWGDDDTMIVFRGEGGTTTPQNAGEVKRRVAAFQVFLKQNGVEVGDTVAGYLPNIPDTVIAMLACVSMGAIWGACSPDFGVSGAYDRLSQIRPKVLLCVDAYWYNGKRFSMDEKNEQLAAMLRPLCNPVIVMVDGADGGKNGQGDAKRAQGDDQGPPFNPIYLTDIYQQTTPTPVHFRRVPFNHPLFILFSSGTTGIPKCIVHGHGGTLIQHLKEHRLHSDIKPGDRVFYYTTCSWMMWHWIVSALASKAVLYLYDGSPFHGGASLLWDYGRDHRLTHMGVSAKYIDALKKSGFTATGYDLSSLRMIWSTGSPLSADHFTYVYDQIPGDFCLASISGGSDIISCFALGNPTSPVYAGELQTPGLGMAVAIYDEDGTPILNGKGELVCTKPFPSQPLGFWGEDGFERYRSTYFTRFKGVWYHGDYGAHTDQGGIVITGRSDTTLNPGGVRVGTADIYAQVQKIPEIVDSVVVGQTTPDNDCRILLFVQLKPGVSLSDGLITQIKDHIRRGETSHHVPSAIYPVPDIPRTHNGKIAEIAVRDVVNNRPVKNLDSLANPHALEAFRKVLHG